MKSFNKFIEEQVGPAVTTWEDWALKYPKTAGVIKHKKQYQDYLDDLEGFLEFKLGTKYKYVEGMFPGNPKTWYEYIALQGKIAEEHWDKEYAKVKEAGFSFNNSQPSWTQHEPPLSPPVPLFPGVPQQSAPPESYADAYKTIVSKPKVINKKPIRMIN